MLFICENYFLVVALSFNRRLTIGEKSNFSFLILCRWLLSYKKPTQRARSWGGKFHTWVNTEVSRV